MKIKKISVLSLFAIFLTNISISTISIANEFCEASYLEPIGDTQGAIKRNNNFYKPKPFSIELEGDADFFLSISGVAKQKLYKQENTWIYESSIEALNHVSKEISFFTIGEQGEIIPQKYISTLSGWLVRDRENTLLFDWDNNQVTHVEEGNFFDVEKYSYDPNLLQLILKYEIINNLDNNNEDTYKLLYSVPSFKCRNRGTLFTFTSEKINTQKFGEVDTKKIYYEAWRGKTKVSSWYANDSDAHILKLHFIDPNTEVNVEISTVE